MYPKNAASPPTIVVGSIYLIADGTIQTSGASARVITAGGAWGAAAGTLAYDTTSGVITYTPTQGETNGEWFIVAVYKASCTSASVTVITTAESTAGKVSLGGTQTANITGNITGNLSGSVGSVTGAVGSVTGAVGSVTGAVGSVAAGVTLANGAITDASLAGNMEIVFETDFATNYNQTRNGWVTNVQDFIGTTAADPFNGTLALATELAKVPKSDGTATWNGTALASILTQAAGALTAYDPPTKTEMDSAFTEIKGATWSSLTDTLEAIRDRGDSAWATATSVTVSDKTGFSLAADQSGVTIGTVTTVTNAVTTDAASRTASKADVSALATSAELADGTVQVGTVQDGAIGAAAVADIFSTTSIAEAYAADGAAGTPAQLLYAIQQALTEFAISGTTITVKKLDGSTTAMTFTLDDGTTPTSRTRAT